MTEAFTIIELTQQSYIKLHEGLSIEQLNKIPQGYSNNLVWNYAHVIASLQMLCYGRAGLSLQLEETFVHAYKIGTKPEVFVTESDYATIKTYADKGIAQLKADYASGFFAAFTPFTTSSGIAINTVEFAISYVIQHHGLHLGYSLAIKKLVL